MLKTIIGNGPKHYGNYNRYEMYSINVLIICYKQENLIGRALDSVLCQKEWGLKNIIVQDDCSPDKTWDVILEYKDRYPDIIIPYRNEKNLGIYGNFSALEKNRGEANIYCTLSGDDAFCNGWFKAVQESLEKRKIELHGVAATICSDIKITRPNGISIINRNGRLVEKVDDVLSMKSRLVVSSRSTMTTADAFDRYEPIITNKGLGIAEESECTRKFQHSDKFYYVPYIATIYYTHVGVSTRLSGEMYYNERKLSYQWMKDYYPLDKKALQYKDYQIAQCDFMINPSLKNYFHMIGLYWIAFDRYTLKDKQSV